MLTHVQRDWSRRADQIVRSRHYTWLGEGLGGAPVETALTQIAADMMHICRREGLSWDEILTAATEQAAAEELAPEPSDSGIYS